MLNGTELNRLLETRMVAEKWLSKHSPSFSCFQRCLGLAEGAR